MLPATKPAEQNSTVAVFIGDFQGYDRGHVRPLSLSAECLVLCGVK